MPIAFMLVVNNFGVKYVGKKHADHLIWCIKQNYKLTKDWTGDNYCGIKLNSDLSQANHPTLCFSGVAHLRKKERNDRFLIIENHEA